METNVGELDRSARIVVGLLLLAVIVSAAGYLELGTAVLAVALLVGIVLLVTGTTRFCLLYRVLGIRTDDTK